MHWKCDTKRTLKVISIVYNIYFILWKLLAYTKLYAQNEWMSGWNDIFKFHFFLSPYSPSSFSRNQKVNHVKNMYENVRWINKFVIWIFCEAMKDNSRALNINSNINIDIFNSWYYHTVYVYIVHVWHTAFGVRTHTQKKELFTQINFDVCWNLVVRRKKFNSIQLQPKSLKHASICNETLSVPMEIQREHLKYIDNMCVHFSMRF